MGTKLHQFYMDKTAARYIFKDGKIAEFIGGVYRTAIVGEIEQLKKEIEHGVSSIWQVPGQEIVDSDDIDPIAVMKRRIIAEYEAGKKHSENTGESKSDQTKALPSGTGTVGVGAAVGAASPVKVDLSKISK